MDSDEEYHSDDSHSSLSSLPPPAIELSSGTGSSGASKKVPRSSPSLFNNTQISDIESGDDVEIKPARSFVFNFWKSTSNIQQSKLASAGSGGSVGATESIHVVKKITTPTAISSFSGSPSSDIDSKPLERKLSECSLSEKYGTLRGVLGKGATATVRLCYPAKSKVKCAVKEFRKRRKEESKVIH